MYHSRKPWWPRSPQNAILMLHGAELVAIVIMICGGLMLTSRSTSLLGLAILGGGFIAYAFGRAERYILELLVWQRELADVQRIEELNTRKDVP